MPRTRSTESKKRKSATDWSSGEENEVAQTVANVNKSKNGGGSKSKKKTVKTAAASSKGAKKQKTQESMRIEEHYEEDSDNENASNSRQIRMQSGHGDGRFNAK